MPHSFHKSKQTTSSSCLLQSLERLISLNRISDAVAFLPLLNNRGLRPPLRTLALLLSRCLSSSPPSLYLARCLHLYLHLTGYKRTYPSFPLLSNRIISLCFLLSRPDDARNLFDRMPTRNVYTYNSMLAGYTRLGMLSAASRLFLRTPVKDVITWNTMIVAFARQGHSAVAVGFFSQLRRSSLWYNPHTFAGLATACVRSGDTRLIRQVHKQVMAMGLLLNLVISSTLVDAYSKNGEIDDASTLFGELRVKDVLCWTTLVSGYAKSGDLLAARRLFDEMPERNSVSWTVLIGGYVRFGFLLEALNLFGRMMEQGVRADQFTFSSGLCACAEVGSVKHGKQIHARLLRIQFKPNAIVVSSLVDMYSRCGDLQGSRRVFEQVTVSKRDSVLWNTMMSAEGQYGYGRETIRLFEEMVSMGMKPDANTFTVLLSSCCLSGLVSEGVQYFECMSERHSIIPEEDHYSCLVELLGQAGRLEEAVRWLSIMRCPSCTRAWDALLSVCSSYRYAKLGKEVAEWLIEVDPMNPKPYALLEDLYSEDGRWESVEKVRQLMQKKKVRENHGTTVLEVDNVIHSFGALAQLHPLQDCIYSVFEHLLGQIDGDSSIT